jgi:hypothetical protein
VEVDNLLLPAPKRKGGNALSALRVYMLLVAKPFVRVREGRPKIDFRRLLKLVYDVEWNVQFILLNATSGSRCFYGSGRR